MSLSRLVLILLLALSLLGAVSACSEGTSNTPAASYVNLSPGAAANLVRDNSGKPDFVILDVRTPAEYADGHIAGAVLIDFYSADFEDRLSQLDRLKRYFVYCRSGNRSGQAARMMIDLGFRIVYNLDGGVEDWSSAGYPLVK